MNLAFSRGYLLFLPTLLACSASKQFIQLTDYSGHARVVHLDDTLRCRIVIDSLKVDSTQYRLFELKTAQDGSPDPSSYWFIAGLDTIQKKIEFRNCHTDSLTASLGQDQIRSLLLSRSPESIRLSRAYNPLHILADPAFVAGGFGIIFGLISLPIPSTPWPEDLKMIGGGLAALGVSALLIGIINTMDGDTEEEICRIKDFH